MFSISQLCLNYFCEFSLSSCFLVACYEGHSFSPSVSVFQELKLIIKLSIFERRRVSATWLSQLTKMAFLKVNEFRVI